MGGEALDTLVERCAGLDAHQDLVVAHARLPGGGRGRLGESATFGTTASQVLPLRRNR